MEYAGNYMIDGDRGDNPGSPYYIEKGRCKCEMCGGMYHSLEEVEYALSTDEEQEPSRFIEVCDSCEGYMRKTKTYILI